jgi:DNA-binding SARP family transcriptional activator
VANEQNLKPRTTLSSEEAKSMGKNGGIASGKARREKATMRKTLEMLLEMENKDGKTYKELATLGLLKGAIKGNSQNYRVILETLGEIGQLQEDRQLQQLNKVDELLSKIESEAKNDIK